MRRSSGCLCCLLTTLAAATSPPWVGFASAAHGDSDREARAESTPREAADCARRVEDAWARGDYDRAVALANEFLARFALTPASPWVRWMKARSLRRKGDQVQSLAEMQFLIEHHPTNAYGMAAMRQVAIDHLQHERWAEAAKLFRRALADPAFRASVYSRLARCYLAMRPPRPEMAALVLEEAIAARKAATGDEREDWDSEKPGAGWNEECQQAREAALHADPVARTLGYLDLLKAGQNERALGYLSSDTRETTALGQVTAQRDTWHLADADLDGIQAPRVESQSEKDAVTTASLPLVGAKSGMAPRKVRFEWVRDADLVWRLAKLPAEVPQERR